MCNITLVIFSMTLMAHFKHNTPKQHSHNNIRSYGYGCFFGPMVKNYLLEFSIYLVLWIQSTDPARTTRINGNGPYG